MISCAGANPILVYHNKMVCGEIVASMRVRRLYDHLAKKLADKNSRYIYDAKKADRAITFIERYCRHSKGKWAGRPVILELWQRAAVAALFGFVDRDTGMREYRELLLIVARKNGKSTLAAAIGNYMLVADGERGPEVYSAATKRDQAKIIWEESVRMVKKAMPLTGVVSVLFLKSVVILMMVYLRRLQVIWIIRTGLTYIVR